MHVLLPDSVLVSLPPPSPTPPQTSVAIRRILELDKTGTNYWHYRTSSPNNFSKFLQQRLICRSAHFA